MAVSNRRPFIRCDLNAYVMTTLEFALNHQHRSIIKLESYTFLLETDSKYTETHENIRRRKQKKKDALAFMQSNRCHHYTSFAFTPNKRGKPTFCTTHSSLLTSRGLSCLLSTRRKVTRRRLFQVSFVNRNWKTMARLEGCNKMFIHQRLMKFSFYQILHQVIRTSKGNLWKSLLAIL